MRGVIMRTGSKPNCGKEIFPNRKAAKQFVKQSHNYYREYICPDCGHWHITSRKSVKRKIKYTDSHTRKKPRPSRHATARREQRRRKTSRRRKISRRKR